MAERQLSPLAEQVLARIATIERRRRSFKAALVLGLLGSGLLLPVLLRDEASTPYRPLLPEPFADPFVARSPARSPDVPPDEAVLTAFEAGGGAAALADVERLLRDDALGEALLGLATEGLERFVNDSPPRQRVAVLDAIAVSPPDVRVRLAGLVLAGLEDTDGLVRSAALRTLVHCFPDDRSHPVLDRVLEKRALHGDPSERVQALRLLDEPRFHHLSGILVQALRDDDPIARSMAALNLGNTRAAQGAGPLKPLLDDPAKNVRASAARALGQLGDRDGNAYLIEQLGDPDPIWRVTVLGYLADVGDPAALVAAREFLETGSVIMKREALRVMAEARTEVDRRFLDEGLASPDPEFRLAAARALLVSGSDEGADAVRRFLDDPKRQVRAARFLLEADRDRFEPDVRSLFERSDPVLRRQLSGLLSSP